MTIYEKIAEIGRNFSFNSFTVFELKGNKGRIIDTVCTLKEAQEYVQIADKNGMKLEIAEYDIKEHAVCFH